MMYYIFLEVSGLLNTKMHTFRSLICNSNPKRYSQNEFGFKAHIVSQWLKNYFSGYMHRPRRLRMSPNRSSQQESPHIQHIDLDFQ